MKTRRKALPKPVLEAAAVTWTELLDEYEDVIKDAEKVGAGAAPAQRRTVESLITWLNKLYDTAYWHREDLVGVFGYKRVEALPQHQTFHVLQRRHAVARLKLECMVETKAKPKKRKPK